MKARGAGAAQRPAWNRPVLVFACGRSGSTLLMRLLNCLEHVTVWGEHAGLVTRLLNAHAALTTDPNRAFIERARPGVEALVAKQPLLSTSATMTGEWMNAFAEDDLLAASRRYLLRLMTVGLPRDRRWGFKEIRYRRPEFDFLRQLFPGAQSLVLVRDPAAVLASQLKNFAGGNPQKLPDLLRQVTSFVAFAAEVAAEAPAGVRIVHYEALAQDPVAAMRGLERFLRDKARADGVRRIAGERAAPPGPSAFAAGGEAGLVAALEQVFAAHGKPAPAEQVRECAALYARLHG